MSGLVGLVGVSFVNRQVRAGALAACSTEAFALTHRVREEWALPMHLTRHKDCRVWGHRKNMKTCALRICVGPMRSWVTLLTLVGTRQSRSHRRVTD